MTRKHTPGPWRVGTTGGFMNSLRIEPCIGVIYGGDNEVRANARLVAAAPLLLEFAISILEDYESFAGLPDGSELASRAREVIGRATISK